MTKCASFHSFHYQITRPKQSIRSNAVGRRSWSLFNVLFLVKARKARKQSKARTYLHLKVRGSRASYPIPCDYKHINKQKVKIYPLNSNVAHTTMIDGKFLKSRMFRYKSPRFEGCPLKVLHF